MGEEKPQKYRLSQGKIIVKTEVIVCVPRKKYPLILWTFRFLDRSVSQFNAHANLCAEGGMKTDELRSRSKSLLKR